MGRTREPSEPMQYKALKEKYLAEYWTRTFSAVHDTLNRLRNEPRLHGTKRDNIDSKNSFPTD